MTPSSVPALQALLPVLSSTVACRPASLCFKLCPLTAIRPLRSPRISENPLCENSGSVPLQLGTTLRRDESELQGTELAGSLLRSKKRKKKSNDKCQSLLTQKPLKVVLPSHCTD
ncbi:hypothetical protein F5Y15DRAFT_238213 [Xylariaceae sp. FL0016]|nr:hypothetical protein F5Y15DRAFT_238213 [Xylariaceae sp. FL0016]